MIPILCGLAVACALMALQGCATVTLNTVCPDTSSGVAFALSGSTVGNQLLSMAGTAAAAGKAGLGGPLNAPAATNTSASMTYQYVPIFGSDAGSLTCVKPPNPAVVVVTSPPASIVH